MTRIKSPHSFHEVAVRDKETSCPNCKTETSKICSWCGKCYACHDKTIEKDY